MKRPLSSQMVAVIFLGFVFWRYLQNTYLWWGRHGREAFMAHEMQRYDRYMATPHTSMATLLAAIILVALFVAVYELIVAGVSKLLDNIQRRSITQ